MRMVWRLLRPTATRPWNYCANCYSETTLLNYTDSQILIKNKQTNNRRLLRHNQALIASFTGENDSFSYYLSLVFRSSLVFAVHSNLENDKYLTRLSVCQSGKDCKAFNAGRLYHLMSHSARLRPFHFNAYHYSKKPIRPIGKVIMPT